MVQQLRWLLGDDGPRLQHVVHPAELMRAAADAPIAVIVLDLPTWTDEARVLCQGTAGRARGRVVILNRQPRQDLVEEAQGTGAIALITDPLDLLNSDVFSSLGEEGTALSTLPIRREIAPGVQLDIRACTVFKDGREILLSPKEFALLQALVIWIGEFVTTDELITAGWGSPTLGYPELVFKQIGKLREKLEDNWKCPTLILHRRGLGYQFTGRRDVPTHRASARTKVVRSIRLGG